MRPGPARQVSFADVELAAQALPLEGLQPSAGDLPLSLA